MKSEIVIDGKNALLGRLASYAAKQALLGAHVIIVNCEDVVISGNPKSVVEAYHVKHVRGGSSMKGPFFPSSPERIVKRTIKGMISHRQARGLAALKRVRCYLSIPEEYKTASFIKAGKEKPIKTIVLKEVTARL